MSYEAATDLTGQRSKPAPASAFDRVLAASPTL